mgnify:CR=1 FL=1
MKEATVKNYIARTNKLVSQKLNQITIPNISSSVARALLLSVDSVLAAKFIGVYLLVAFFLCLQMFKDLKEANYTAIVLISCFLFGVFLLFLYKMYWSVEYDDEKILIHRCLETVEIPLNQLVLIENRYLAYSRGARDIWRFCFEKDSSLYY